MASDTPHPRDTTPPAIPDEAERERQRIVSALAELGFALPGSITQRMQRCGKPWCRCSSDPEHLHGPYIQWTRAVKGKTVTKILNEEQLRRYQPWLDNGRQLRELAHQLNQLSLDTIQTIEGWGAKR